MVLYVVFVGTRVSNRVSMLFSPFSTRAMRPEERLSTGTLAISKSLRKPIALPSKDIFHWRGNRRKGYPDALR